MQAREMGKNQVKLISQCLVNDMGIDGVRPHEINKCSKRILRVLSVFSLFGLTEGFPETEAVCTSVLHRSCLEILTVGISVMFSLLCKANCTVRWMFLTVVFCCKCGGEGDGESLDKPLSLTLSPINTIICLGILSVAVLAFMLSGRGNNGTGEEPEPELEDRIPLATREPQAEPLTSRYPMRENSDFHPAVVFVWLHYCCQERIERGVNVGLNTSIASYSAGKYVERRGRRMAWRSK